MNNHICAHALCPYFCMLVCFDSPMRVSACVSWQSCPFSIPSCVYTTTMCISSCEAIYWYSRLLKDLLWLCSEIDIICSSSIISIYLSEAFILSIYNVVKSLTSSWSVLDGNEANQARSMSPWVVIIGIFNFVNFIQTVVWNSVWSTTV